MRTNLLKSKMLAGELAYGVISPTYDPIIAEYIGLLGFDYYMIDGEHGPLTVAQAADLIRACELHACTPVARIRSVDEKLILQYMDAGVMGVMMPSIKTVSEVERLVSAIKYPPQGQRGLGPVRAASYLMGAHSQAQYVKFANEQTLVLPQIENMACVDALEEIVQVEGVDGFIIGPQDLAMSMGYYDGPDHPEVEKMIDHIFNLVLDNHKFVGSVAGTAKQAQVLKNKGATMILNSVQSLLKAAGKQFLSVRDA
jgi:4-hydroxy-2-oxoheptanedioate aldolase